MWVASVRIPWDQVTLCAPESSLVREDCYQVHWCIDPTYFHLVIEGMRASDESNFDYCVKAGHDTKDIAEEETEFQGKASQEWEGSKERNDKKLPMSKAGER